MASRAGVWVSRSLKFAALAVGGPLALLGGMALVGHFIANGWARLGIALAAIIVVPAIVADRLLPDANSENSERGRGIVTDVLAISWLGFALVMFGVGIGQTRPLIDQEAQRLHAANFTRTAEATRWLSGGQPLLSDTAIAAKDGTAGDLAPSEADKPADKPTDKPTAKADKPAADKPADKPKVSDKPLKPEELFKKWAPSVVTVSIGSGPHGGGGGTGFIVDSGGTVITNHHVVGESTSVGVKLKNGQWADKVELLFADKDRDIAILRISPAEELLPTILGSSENVAVGERVISIGNPLGLEHTLTDGLISARRKYDGQKMIQMSAPVSPGNSGGPLFNLKGEVIGVTVATVSGFGRGQNLNLAIPIDEVKAFFKDDYPDAKKIGGGGPDMGTW